MTLWGYVEVEIEGSSQVGHWTFVGTELSQHSRIQIWGSRQWAEAYPEVIGSTLSDMAHIFTEDQR